METLEDGPLKVQKIRMYPNQEQKEKLLRWMGDETFSTQVINKNLNPEWNASFDYKIDPKNPCNELRFICWDKDIFGNDYMGETTINLLNFWESNEIGYYNETNKPQQFPLVSARKSEEVSGQILIKIGLIDNQNKFLDEREWNSIWSQMNNLHIKEDSTNIANSNDIASIDNAMKHHKKSPSIAKLNEVIGVIFLEVVKAKDLPPEKDVTKLGFDMDPFVVVSFSKKTFRTQVISHDLNPVWNEKLHFPILKSEEKYSIKFTVYDWDKFSDNDLVASKYLSVKPLIDKAEQKYEHKYKLLDANDEMIEEALDLEVHSKRKDQQSKLYVRIKFIPYEQLRTQFWMALAKIYDTDENGVMNFLEIETMLNSIGSSLTVETISTFFTRFGKNPHKDELQFEELVQCLENHLREHKEHKSANYDGEEADDEHLIYLKECPICHGPDLSQLSETDIVTHVAICASHDLGKVSNIITGDFVTESQAQRKWVTKVITKVGFGGYKVGGNNANIIVQDRLTGHLVEEKMAAYVRLGIPKNLLQNLSVKQGKKFDKPSSAGDIVPFIKFHNLNKDEILDPLDSFKNFNEFFYRKLKPSARLCDSPQDPHVLVSPADCRMMAFPTIDFATQIWIKGQNFSVARLLDDEEAAKDFEGGSLGIFRLAPQDYHRYHFPVEGELSEPHGIKGAFYTVNPMAIRSELDVYGENKRVVSYINSPQFGKVAYICVGAMMVGSIVLTSKPQNYIRRLEEHGYFAFGGSTVVLLFQKGRMLWDEDILANSTTCLETLVRVGMHVGKSTVHHQ
ncbi:3475_t:CDS:10 [Diversispora eburnea]|uniref:phosphatidylserine decarboxylase n=1 Tax=Diversispora eburnea TaxID=1213867 RepID=A0A9N8W4R3_9GLOM|nr:3475_t:CDS:10 [Diversispora eburnea]